MLPGHELQNVTHHRLAFGLSALGPSPPLDVCGGRTGPLKTLSENQLGREAPFTGQIYYWIKISVLHKRTTALISRLILSLPRGPLFPH